MPCEVGAFGSAETRRTAPHQPQTIRSAEPPMERGGLAEVDILHLLRRESRPDEYIKKRYDKDDYD